MAWEEHFKIHSQFTGSNCRLTLPSMAQLFQDSAEGDTNAHSAGYYDMLNDGTAWVLSRICYEIVRPPMLYEECTVRTWSRGTEGVFALRDFEFVGNDGQVWVRGTSKWVVIDINNRRLLRMGERFMRGYQIEPRRAIDYDLGKMLPHSGLQKVNVVDVPFSAIDKAKHVNNSVYLRWVADNLEPQDLDRPVKFVEINYIHETHFGDKVVINRAKEGDTYHFSLENAKGTGFLCDLQMA